MRRQKRTGKYCLKSLEVWNVSRRVWVKGIGEGMRTLVICENNNALLCITWNYPLENRFLVLLAYTRRLIIGWGRVAELGSLSSGAKMAMKIFVKRVFTIFATNASFLRVIANLQILLSKLCNTYHVIVHLLPKKYCLWPKKALFLPKDLQNVRKSRQILIRDKYVRA